MCPAAWCRRSWDDAIDVDIAAPQSRVHERRVPSWAHGRAWFGRNGRGGARARGRRPGRCARAGAGRAAHASIAPPRLDVRAVADPRDRLRGGLVVVGGPSRQRGASGQPGAGSAVHRVRCGIARDRVRPAVGHRHLRHGPVLRPHGAARPAGARGGAAHRARRADHATVACLVGDDPATLDPPGPPLPGHAGPGVPGRDLAGVRLGDVAGALLAAVRRGAGGPTRPRPGARAVPRHGGPVLVARRGPGSLAVADGASGPRAVRLHPDDSEHLPCRRDPRRHDRPVSALRHARARVGIGRARGPAGRGRDHVDRR